MPNSMDLRYWYFGQQVQNSELREAFTAVESAFGDRLIDAGSYGIALHPFGSGTKNLQVTEYSTPNMTVQVAVGRAYTKEGDRMIRLLNTDYPDLSVDNDGASTIPSSGNERYVSLFMVPGRTNTDQRFPNSGSPIYFNQALNHGFEVIAGTQASAGTASKPALRTDAILLCDVLLQNGTTAITDAADPYAPAAAEIDTTRREYFTIQPYKMSVNDVVAAKYLTLQNAAGHASWGENGEGRVHLENTVHAWAVTDGAGTFVTNHGFVSVTKTGTGQYSYSLGTDVFTSSANWSAHVQTTQTTGGATIYLAKALRAGTHTLTVEIYTHNTSTQAWTAVDLDHDVILVGRQKNATSSQRLSQ